MISTSDFRKGRKLKIEGDLWEILDFQNARTAQRRAKVTTRLRNLRTGQVLEKVFASGETFDEPQFEQRSMQYMYTDGSAWHFMDNQTYEQMAMTAEQLGGCAEFLMENQNYKVLYFEGNPLSLDLPSSVVLEVTDAEPAVKGDTVSNLTKGAILETGLKVKVPLFIKVGDKVKVKVLEVDRDRERISLSIRQTAEDPWEAFAQTTDVGSDVDGKVTKTVPFGAFVSVGEGVEGLVHVSEIAMHHVESPELELSLGQEVKVKVTEIDADRRRVSLSIKQALPEWEERSSWSEKKPSSPRRREFQREEEATEAPSFSADSSLEAILAELKERGIGRS